MHRILNIYNIPLLCAIDMEVLSYPGRVGTLLLNNPKRSFVKNLWEKISLIQKTLVT